MVAFAFAQQGVYLHEQCAACVALPCPIAWVQDQQQKRMVQNVGGLCAVPAGCGTLCVCVPGDWLWSTLNGAMRASALSPLPPHATHWNLSSHSTQTHSQQHECMGLSAEGYGVGVGSELV